MASGEPTIVSDQDRGIVDVPGGRLSRDRRLKVYSRHGDIYLKDLTKGEITQLTRTAAVELDPHFTADGNGIFFRRGNSVLVRHLQTSLEDQPAELRLTDDPDAKKENEAQKDDNFLAAQQLRLFDVLRREKEEKESIREREKQEQAADPKPAAPPLLSR